MNKTVLVLVILLINIQMLICQDLSQLKEEKWSSFSGFLGGSTTYSTLNARTPLGYYINLGLNWKIKGFNLPLNLSYGVNGFGANTINLRRLGFSPGYKNLTLHAGYRSYQLNNYLLTGKTIIGGGIEWNPKRFGILAFYGKFNDLYSAGNDYFLLDESIQAYDRWIIGGKLRFGTENNHFALGGMKIYEDPESGSFDSLKILGISPKQNFGLNADLKLNLFKKIQFFASVVGSIVTNNTEGLEIVASPEDQKIIDQVKPLLIVNQTSRLGLAYQGSLSFPIARMQLGLKYEAVDQHFNSLGVSFNQGNYENITVNLFGPIGKRINLGISAGQQRVHKEGFTGLPQRRLIVNANANILITNNFSLNGGYNNNQQNSAPIVEEVQDSIRLKINNSGWTGSSVYTFGKKDKMHRIMLNASSFQFELVSQDTLQSSNLSNNYVLSYQYIPKNNWHFGGGVNYQTTNINFELPTQRMGVSTNISRSVKGGLNIKFDAGFRLNNTQGNSDGFIINAGTNFNYPIMKKHKLTFSFQYFDRKTSILKAKRGFHVRAAYNYTF